MAHRLTHHDGHEIEFCNHLPDILFGGITSQCMDTNAQTLHRPTDEPTTPPDPAVPPDLMARPVWSTAEVADVLGVSPATVKRMIGERDFPRPRRVNRMLWWLPADIVDWVAAPARGATGHRGSRRG